jgi:hypothetical protein
MNHCPFLTRISTNIDEQNDEKDTVGVAGVMKYCTDLGVDTDNASFFVLQEAVLMPALGEMTKEQFIAGWKEA